MVESYKLELARFSAWLRIQNGAECGNKNKVINCTRIQTKIVFIRKQSTVVSTRILSKIVNIGINSSIVDVKIKSTIIVINIHQTFEKSQ